MNIITGIFKKIEQSKSDGMDICNRIDAFVVSVDQELTSESFVDVTYANDVKRSCEDLNSEVDGLGLGTVLLMPKLKYKKTLLNELAGDISGRISLHNDKVASTLAEKARQLIGDVEGRQLDDQQMKCIIKPANNHLVIAGAGTHTYQTFYLNTDTFLVAA